MNTLMRLVLIVMLAALPLKSMVPVAYAEAASGASAQGHCAEHAAPEPSADVGGTQCNKHCDCCVSSGLAACAIIGLPERAPDAPAQARKTVSPSFITSAPERPPRALLA